MEAWRLVQSRDDFSTHPSELAMLRDILRPRVNLSRRPGEPPLDVDMEAFFEFSFWMAEELLDLIASHEQKDLPTVPLPVGVLPPNSFRKDSSSHTPPT